MKIEDPNHSVVLQYVIIGLILYSTYLAHKDYQMNKKQHELFMKQNGIK
jgi:hypothetical protein